MYDEVSLTDEVHRLICQGILEGTITLASGRMVKLSDASILRLIALVKSSKGVVMSSVASALIPEDFHIPMVPDTDTSLRLDPPLTDTVKPMQDTKENLTPQQVESHDHQKDTPKAKSKAIDFEELERQINRNTKPEK